MSKFALEDDMKSLTPDGSELLNQLARGCLLAKQNLLALRKAGDDWRFEFPDFAASGALACEPARALVDAGLLHVREVREGEMIAAVSPDALSLSDVDLSAVRIFEL